MFELLFHGIPLFFDLKPKDYCQGELFDNSKKKAL